MSSEHPNKPDPTRRSSSPSNVRHFSEETQRAPSPSSPHATQRAMPWFSENYFTTQHPVTRAQRGIYIKILAIMSAMVIVFMMACLSIYWGALWQVPSHAHGLNAWVVDNDGAEVGQFITQAIKSVNGNSNVLNFQFVTPNPSGPTALIRDLVDEKAWLIISINANATASLNLAASAANSSYNGSSAITVYSEEARNENAYRTIIRPTFQAILDTASEKFAVQFLGQIQASGANLTNIAANAPTILTQPISFVEDNVRPFDVPVATAVSFVGLIYLLVLAFFITMIHWAARVDATHLDNHLTFSSLIVIRIVTPFIIYFFLSLFYAFISLAFQTPFGRFYGSSGFVIYWMMSWMSMSALGFSTESIITILTPRFIPFFLLLWIVVNVSVSLLPIQVLPGVFRYGYAMPFYNVSRTVRTIVFNTKNEIGMNFGVQFAWIAVSIAGIVLFELLRRHNAIKAHRSELAHMENEKHV